MTNRCPENEILAKGNNSNKSKSNAQKSNLFLSCQGKLKYQISSPITKDGREKSGKTKFLQRVIIHVKEGQT